MTGNRNRTLRMWSALGGLVVVGIIALFTALGHHPTPTAPNGTLYNLSSPGAQQGGGGLTVTTPPAAPTPASNTFTYVNPYQGPAGGATCTPVAQTATRARYRVSFNATSPVKIVNFDVAFWTPEGGQITTAAVAPPSLTMTTGQSRTLRLFTPATSEPGGAAWGPPGPQPGWACTVTQYTVAR